ncbi:hypothetical protein FF38_06772 [Lucilia cuprina]|uniref:Uncharacterized protein n=1 Tax=Lucilia cuprina TaxID=7375 RepID=A0A0L0CRH1_LUCCU|nr:hypothetical protein FF38_06772 [Lucilia cuprina]
MDILSTMMYGINDSHRKPAHFKERPSNSNRNHIHESKSVQKFISTTMSKLRSALIEANSCLTGQCLGFKADKTTLDFFRLLLSVSKVSNYCQIALFDGGLFQPLGELSAHRFPHIRQIHPTNLRYYSEYNSGVPRYRIPNLCMISNQHFIKTQ